MGRAMIIIVLGLLLSLGYTFIGMSGQRSSLTSQSVDVATKSMGQNLAYSGVQFAIANYEESAGNSWTGPETLTMEEGSVTISSRVIATFTDGSNRDSLIRISSTAQIGGANNDYRVESTFDVSKKQQLVPDFAGALSNVSGDVDFDKGNPKIHFDGNDKTGKCSNLPGMTVSDPNKVDNYSDSDNIEGNPPVAVDNTLTHEYISDLIEKLAPGAQKVDKQYDWGQSTPENPGVYVVDGETQFAGKNNGYGILIVSNNASLDIEAELGVAGQFEFNGLVIFENQVDFKGTGNANFNGSVMTISDNGLPFDIKANGNFLAQYDCLAKKYADAGLNDQLNTTLFRQTSVFDE